MTRSTHPSAFSLIELSLVILIIGILITGVLQGSTLVSKIRLSSARSLTTSSPVPGIKNLLLWFEATSEKSFLSSETQNNSALSRWFDINPQLNQHLYFQQNAVNSANHPLYITNCINGLPCVRFSGNAIGSTPNFGGMNLLGQIPGTFQYISLFVVLTTPNDNFVPNSGVNNGLMILTSTNVSLQLNNTGQLTYPSGGGKGILEITPELTTTNLVTNSIATNYIFSVIDDNSENIYEYINGAVGNDSGAVGTLDKTIGQLRLGYYPNSAWPERFKGNIAEIIIYTKALKEEERKSVEKYLSQKWNIALNY